MAEKRSEIVFLLILNKYLVEHNFSVTLSICSLFALIVCFVLILDLASNFKGSLIIYLKKHERYFIYSIIKFLQFYLFFTNSSPVTNIFCINFWLCLKFNWFIEDLMEKYNLFINLNLKRFNSL